MKNFTILVAVLMLSHFSHAQITYESSDYAQAGQSYNLTKAPLIPNGIYNFAATGANYNWNFANLDAASQSSFAYANPNNAGYKISWCFLHGYLFNCNSQFNNNFNLAQLVTAGTEFQDYGITNVIEHSKLSAAALQTKMVGMTMGFGALAVPVAVDYDTPDTVYEFPMTFGQNTSSNAAFNVDMSALGFPMTYSATIARSNTVEGWGSLTTPMGTFASVLKVKTVVQRIDVFSYEGIEIPIPSTTVSFKWFDKNFGVPVLQADGMQLGPIFVPTNVIYLDEALCLPPLAAFNLIPFGTDYDPQTQSASVGFANTSINFDVASWDFGDGAQASETNASHTFACPGIHDVTLTITNSQCTPAQTATVTVPIEITDSQNAFTTEVLLEGQTLTAQRTLAGTTYQWVDCDNANAPITGAVSATFEASVSGNYACVLHTNGCESLTACTGVTVLRNDTFDASQISLLPNPTHGKLQLSGNLKIDQVEVYNALGMLVGRELDLTTQPSGAYFIRIITERGTMTKTVLRN